MNKYNSYKDSGIEWIGEIPSHWKKTNHKFNLSILSGYPFKSELFDKSEGFPLIRIRDISSGKIETYYQGEVLDKFVVNEGDLLIGMDGDFNTRWWNSEQGLLNQRCCSIIEGSDVLRRYLHYVLPIELNIINDLTYYTTVKHLSVDDINNTDTILPPLSEQKQIVSFLDTKTSLIDSLIEKTHRKIELLKEKRTSLINEVVIKGLNSNVEMKDSGVEWIGEIPSHWELKKTKHIRSKDKYSLVDGPVGSNLKSVHYVENGDVYIVESGFVTSGKFKFGREFKTITKEHFETIKRSECFEGCIIMSKIGEYYGMTGILPKLDKPSVVSGNTISIKISDSFNTNFIHKVLLQHWKNGTFKKEVQQTGQPFISMTMVNNIVFPIPPFQEQQQIVEYLDEQTQLIDNTISIEEKRIELLKEYRQSLISEVVTGKLKVTTDE